MIGGRISPIRVLVVDDDARVRAALSQTIALESGLVMVAAVADTAAALAWAERCDSDVALIDLFLPELASGLTLVRLLAQRTRCPVVAMSMRGGCVRQHSPRAPARFVEKDCDIDAVLHAVSDRRVYTSRLEALRPTSFRRAVRRLTTSKYGPLTDAPRPGLRPGSRCTQNHPSSHRSPSCCRPSSSMQSFSQPSFKPISVSTARSTDSAWSAQSPSRPASSRCSSRPSSPTATGSSSNWPSAAPESFSVASPSH